MIDATHRLVIFATFWALFAPDIQISKLAVPIATTTTTTTTANSLLLRGSGCRLAVGVPKAFDKSVAVVTLCSFCLFLFELVMNFVVGRDYGGAAGLNKISIFFTIDVLGTLSIIPEFLILFGISQPAVGSAALARAGRAARIGARMGRLVRMFRLDAEEPEIAPDGTVLETQASDIGLIVADKIASRVVLLVMSLIILIPMFTYAPEPSHTQLSLDLFKGARVSAADPTAAISLDELKNFVTWYNRCDYTRCARTEELVAFKLIDDDVEVDLRLNDPAKYELYRRTEFTTIKSDHFEATYMTRTEKVLESTYSLAFLLSAVMLFAIGAGMFLQDIQEHVITPIEKLSALSQNLGATLSFITRDPDDDQDEVEFLDSAIQKMEGLLRVGYGEAGTNIIGRNLQGTSEKLDPLLPGMKIDGLVGFIMLCDFGLVTQCLEEDVMLYANYVGEVIHKCVEKYGGSPNKNMGGAILCVWKGNATADGAFKAFQEAIDTVNDHAALTQLIKGSRELNDLRPGFKCELKGGLHCGWIIEGAVGSTHKIDASYLSPNVNLAARLETASFQYGAEIMMSDIYYDKLPTGTQATLRKLDRVTVKGSEQPMVLWAPSLGVAESEESLGKMNTFTADYCAAVDDYISGSWTEAKAGLEACSALYPDDLAPKALLTFMAGQGGSAPGDWPNCRALNSK